jgi:hypothetical protein
MTRAIGASLVAVALAAATASGCGLEEGPRQNPAPHARGVVPTPRVSTQETLRQLREAAQSSSCTLTRRLLHPVLRAGNPGLCEQLHSRLAGIADARAASYRTGMVVDFTTTTGANRAAILALDASLAFRLVVVLDISARTVGTRSPPRVFDRIAQQTMDALAHEDCEGFLAVASHTLGVGRGTREQVCARIPKLGVTQELHAHPGVRAERLGGNRAFAFYALRFAPGSYYTAFLTRESTRPPGQAPQRRYVFVTALPAK